MEYRTRTVTRADYEKATRSLNSAFFSLKKNEEMFGGMIPKKFREQYMAQVKEANKRFNDLLTMISVSGLHISTESVEALGTEIAAIRNLHKEALTKAFRARSTTEVIRQAHALRRDIITALSESGELQAG